MNPLLLRLIPVALSVLAGFAIAWGIQGLRLTSAEQEFTAFKQNQVRIFQEHKDNADKQRQESARNYETARNELATVSERAEIYKRCVAAGRCGVCPSGVRKSAANTPGNGLSTRPQLDEASANAVPLAGEPAAPGVIYDCAYTTLQLNHLQADIEEQPGYSQ